MTAAGVELQPRDVRVLELLAQRHVETLEWLCETVFRVTTKRTRNRLGQLARDGYVQAERLPILDGERSRQALVYRLGPRGREALLLTAAVAGRLLLSHDSASRAPRAVPHQLAINRVVDRLGADALEPAEIATGLPRDPTEWPDFLYEAMDDNVDEPSLVWVVVDVGHYRAEHVVAVARALARTRNGCRLLIVVPSLPRWQALAEEIALAARYRGDLFHQGRHDAPSVLRDLRIEMVTTEDLVERRWPAALDPRRYDRSSG